MVGVDIRVLVAFEEDYRTYRETIAIGLQILRPNIEVEAVSLEALESELERSVPQVVISSGHEEEESASRAAWIELSLDPTQPSKIRVGARHLEQTNPTLRELVEIIDDLM